MKNIFLLIFIVSTLSYSHGNEIHSTDGTAGASLNEQKTIKKYKQLSKLTNEAIKENDWFKKEHVYDEILVFLKHINSYDGISSLEAKKDVAKYNKALKKRLTALKKVNGIGLEKLNKRKVRQRYLYVLKLAKNASQTGKGKKRAIAEINDLTSFIKKWKSSQTSSLQEVFNEIEESLEIELNSLKG